MTENTTPTETETYDRDELRVELLLHLPALAFERIPSATDPEYVTVRRDRDYNVAALADWILDRIEAARAADASDDVLAEVAMMATAQGMLATYQDTSAYLLQLSNVLQRNMSIAEQWDLSRTIREEVKRIAGVRTNLLKRYPALGAAAPVELILPGQ